MVDSMSSESWVQAMTDIQTAVRSLACANVLDIEFINGERREVFVAATPESRSTGLSHQSELAVDGMLFVYETPSYVPFTAVDMRFDMDIAWYDHTGTVLRHLSVTAGDRTALFSPSAFSYVLETASGNLPEANLKVRY
jgi:uncharacterized membrane protein (UPF0127 family)